MSFFKRTGTLFNGMASLTSATPVTIFTPPANCWADVFSINLTTNESAVRQVTLSDGVTNIVYFVGGGAPPPITDDAATPIRFRRGAAITATASGVTATKTIAVNIRGLLSVT